MHRCGAKLLLMAFITGHNEFIEDIFNKRSENEYMSVFDSWFTFGSYCSN